MDQGGNSQMLRINTPGERTPFPSFSKPYVRGCFSLDSNRGYVPGPEYLKFLKLPDNPNQVNFDLDKLTSQQDQNHDAFSDSEEMHKQTNELVHLLHWIHIHESLFNKKKPHFVFYRGLMTKILGTPYEARDGWKIGAMLKNGTIYLRNVDTLEAIQDRARQSADPRQRRMASWGYNFEHFLLSDSPNTKPNLKEISKNECNLVFQTKLGSHELLYAAEIDGGSLLFYDFCVPCEGKLFISAVWQQIPTENKNPKLNPDLLNECCLVELKTTRIFPGNQMKRNFRKFNLRKWFCQSYSVGISHVIAGLRDDDGIVKSLRVFPIKELSDLRLEWSANVCFKFLEVFLTEVKRVVNEREGFVFIFEYDPLSSNRFEKTIRVSTEKVTDSDLYLPNIK